VTKYMLVVVASVAFLAVGANAEDAKAQGFHFSSGGVHVDFGHPHGGYRHFGHSRHAPHSVFHGSGHWGGHGRWHDTTHLDYHPGGFVPHFNHFHYVPGHYDVHHSGHFHGRRYGF